VWNFVDGEPMILVPSHRAARRCALALASVLALVGCNGGTVDRHALERDSEKISSFAAEGELLANDVSKGATTRIFARVHSKELSVAMSNLADALAERKTSPGIEQKVRRASQLAATVSAQFEQLHLHPTDRALAKRLQGAFRADGDAAGKLAK
jgi:hypothetical protein